MNIETIELNPKTIWTEDFKLGASKEWGKGIKLSAPTFDCDWYWGFGYLGNKNCHYHLDSYKQSNMNLRDYLINEFGDSLRITENRDLWVFCDLMVSAYTLNEAAEVYYRGGSHYCRTVISPKLKQLDKYQDIVSRELPLIFDTIEKEVLIKYR